MSAFAETHHVATTQARFAVVRVDGHYRVLTTRAIARGEPILALEGIIVREPSRYSVQVGADEHLESALDEKVEFALDQRPWRFLNHSCDPTARVDGRRLIAARDLNAWEQVTFDYNTTEYRLAAPFRCRCGALDCCGEVRGFSRLDAGQRAARAPFAAAYLLLDSQGQLTRDEG